MIHARSAVRLVREHGATRRKLSVADNAVYRKRRGRAILPVSMKKTLLRRMRTLETWASFQSMESGAGEQSSFCHWTVMNFAGLEKRHALAFFGKHTFNGSTKKYLSKNNKIAVTPWVLTPCAPFRKTAGLVLAPGERRLGQLLLLADIISL